MANPIQPNATFTPSSSIRKGNVVVGINPAEYSQIGNFWSGIDCPAGGYVTYINKPTNGPSIYVSPSDEAYVNLVTGDFKAPGVTGVASALTYVAGLSDRITVNLDYPNISTSGLVMMVDAGYTPSYPRGGTSWYDLGPSNLYTTLINGPSYGLTGAGAIVFDGTNDYVTMGSPFDFGQPSNITVSIWVNYSSFVATGNGRAIFKSSSLNENTGITIYQNTGVPYNTLKTYVNTASGLVILTSTTPLYTNQWYQMTVSYDSSTLKIFINGVLDSSLSGTGAIVWPSPTRTPVMGVSYGSYFRGAISSTWVYNNALSSTTIYQNYQNMLYRFLNPSLVKTGLTFYADASLPFYGGTGSSWADASGYGNTSILYNNPTFTTGGSGAIIFDGTDDYTQTINELGSYSSDFTVETWFQWSTANSTSIGFITAGVYEQMEIHTGGDSGTGGIRLIPNTWPASSLDIPNAVPSTSNWYSVTMVYNKGVSTVGYISGSLRGTKSHSVTTPTTSSKLTMGRRTDTTFRFNGQISNTKIYNKALTYSEVIQNYQALFPRFLGQNITADGLVLYCDAGYNPSYSGSGTSWLSVSGGTGATGALTNGASYAATGGGSIVYDGSDDHVSFPNIPSLRPTSFTSSTWIYNTDSDGRQQTIFSSYSELMVAGFFVQIWNSPHKIRFVLGANTGGGAGIYADVTGSTTININQWYHITASYDGSSMKIYVNGVLDLDYSWTNGIGYDTVNNRVISGAVYSKTSGIITYFKGNISVTSLYQRALTPTEVLQNFNAQKSRYGL